MKKKVFMMAIMLVMTLTTTADVMINGTTFPDEDFRNWVLDQEYGKDGVLTEEEIAEVTFMNLFPQNIIAEGHIQSLKGIEYFTAMTKLVCSRNELKELDLSKNTALTWLECYGNHLTGLYLSNNPELTYLDCQSNELTTLDVSSCTRLTELNCFDNQLTTLNVSGCSALTMLKCYSNPLTELNVHGCTSLTTMWVFDNKLPELDASDCTSLTTLWCDNNQLTLLDVSSNKNLAELRCGKNQLTQLEVSKNTMLTELRCEDNQLTALDLSKNIQLTSLRTYHNPINGESMDALIESLPTVSHGGWCVVLSEDEEDVVTATQIAAAKAKGWISYYWNESAKNWMEYAGQEYFPEGTKWTEIRLDTLKYDSWYSKVGDEWVPNFETIEYYVQGEYPDRDWTYKKVYTNGPEWTDSLTLLIQEAHNNVLASVLSHDYDGKSYVLWPGEAYQFDWNVGKDLYYEHILMQNTTGTSPHYDYGIVDEIKEGYFGGVRTLRYVNLNGGRIIQGIGITEWNDGECLFGPPNPYSALQMYESHHWESYPERHYRSMLVHFERNGEVLYDVWPEKVQTAYYYYKGEKVPLTLNEKKICVSIPKDCGDIIERFLANTPTLDKIRDELFEIYLIRRSDYNKLTMLDFWAEDTKSVILTSSYYTENNEEICTTPYLDVRLKKEEDVDLLTSYAEQYKLNIVKNSPLMPLWYILNITPESEMNTLECANALYESGDFAESVPDWAYNYKIEEPYRPFVEEGKVWKVGNCQAILDNSVQMVDYYYFDGDTIIDGKTFKQMMCQRFVGPDFSDEYGYWTPKPFLKKVGAWYEEDQKVYFYDEIIQSMKLMYDFSLGDYETVDFLNVDGYPPYIIGPKQTGGIKGFKGVYRDIMMGQDINTKTPWLEGVGGLDGPFASVYHPLADRKPDFLMSCGVGDEVIYYNDEYEDGATPAGARKNRFDFTHTIKEKPKTRIKQEESDACISSSERDVARPKVKTRISRGEEQSLYGEYNDLQLGINLDLLNDAYQVRITNESGKAVYEKIINAGSIVGLSIDISKYPEGNYTVTVENSNESFTGEFKAQLTGIEEVRSKKIEVKGHIYNLQGQRLSRLQKGLNIVNGQKIYIK